MLFAASTSANRSRPLLRPNGPNPKPWLRRLSSLPARTQIILLGRCWLWMAGSPPDPNLHFVQLGTQGAADYRRFCHPPKPPYCAKVPHSPRISAPLNSSHPGNIFKDFAPLSSAEEWHRDCSPAKRHCWAVETLACELTAPRGHYAILQTLVAAEFQSRPE